MLSAPKGWCHSESIYSYFKLNYVRCICYDCTYQSEGDLNITIVPMIFQKCVYIRGSCLQSLVKIDPERFEKMSIIWIFPIQRYTYERQKIIFKISSFTMLHYCSTLKNIHVYAKWKWMVNHWKTLTKTLICRFGAK